MGPVSCQNHSGQVNQLGLQMGMMPGEGTRLVGTCPGSRDSVPSPVRWLGGPERHSTAARRLLDRKTET